MNRKTHFDLFNLFALFIVIAIILVVGYLSSDSRVMATPITKSSSVPLCLNPFYNSSENAYYCKLDDLVVINNEKKIKS